MTRSFPALKSNTPPPTRFSTVRRITSVQELTETLRAGPTACWAIVNPYGERFPVAGPGQWRAMLDLVRGYVNQGGGWLTKWEPVEKNQGMQGLAIVVDPRAFDAVTEDKLNHLVVLKPGITTPVSYWAGFAWDRAGKITSAESWNAYVDQFGERLRSPIEVTVK